MAFEYLYIKDKEKVIRKSIDYLLYVYNTRENPVFMYKYGLYIIYFIRILLILYIFFINNLTNVYKLLYLCLKLNYNG